MVGPDGVLKYYNPTNVHHPSIWGHIFGYPGFWSKLPQFAPIPDIIYSAGGHRLESAYLLLANGTLFANARYPSYTNILYQYCPAMNQWSKVWKEKTFGFGATEFEHIVYLDSSFYYLHVDNRINATGVLIIDGDKNERVRMLPRPLMRNLTMSTYDGKVVVYGQAENSWDPYEMFVFDPKRDQWTEVVSEMDVDVDELWEQAVEEIDDTDDLEELREMTICVVVIIVEHCGACYRVVLIQRDNPYLDDPDPDDPDAFNIRYASPMVHKLNFKFGDSVTSVRLGTKEIQDSIPARTHQDMLDLFEINGDVFAFLDKPRQKTMMVRLGFKVWEDHWKDPSTRDIQRWQALAYGSDFLTISNNIITYTFDRKKIEECSLDE